MSHDVYPVPHVTKHTKTGRLTTYISDTGANSSIDAKCVRENAPDCRQFRALVEIWNISDGWSLACLEPVATMYQIHQTQCIQTAVSV